MPQIDWIAAAATPHFDGAYFVGLVSRLAHTTCGAVLLGGLVYLRCVLAPSARAAGDAAETLFAGRRTAWAGVVALASLLLLASGFYNFFLFLGRYDNLPKLYHPLFGVKFLCGLGVMAIAALVAGKTGLAQRVRARLTLWLNVAIALAVATFLLGAMLRSFRDLPDARSLPAATAPDGAPAP